MLAWLTIDEPGAETCRVFHIPENFVPHVMGALGELTYADNWEQDGILTPDECAEFMGAMWESVGGCGMIGEICLFDTQVLPADFLLCDGAEYLRVDYQALYDVIADVYKTDADHFIAPQRMAKFIRGGESAGVEGGANTISVGVNNMPAHSHTDLGHAHSEITALPNLTTIGVEVPQPTALPGVGVTGLSYANIQNTGGGEDIVSIPLYMSALVGIRWR
jgi:microcystin-dependent protein